LLHAEGNGVRINVKKGFAAFPSTEKENAIHQNDTKEYFFFL